MKLLLDLSNVDEWVAFRTQQCHAIAKAGGWWTDLSTGQPKERNKAEMLCLIHSEISEALLGVGKPDDKLPEYDGQAVEIVDAFVRIFDFLGGTDTVPTPIQQVIVGKLRGQDVHYLNAEAHMRISMVLEAVRRNRPTEAVWADLISWLITYYRNVHYIGQLDTIIDAKLAFNQQREDHKIENRIKADGKKI